MSKVIVYHGMFGCQTGCCGHWVEVDGDPDSATFSFSHPYSEDFKDYAKMLVAAQFSKEHVADLDWENCVIVDD